MPIGWIVFSIFVFSVFAFIQYLRGKQRKKEKQRSERLEHLAAHYGMAFALKPDKTLREQLRKFHRFERTRGSSGHGQSVHSMLSSIRNVIRGNIEGAEFVFFEVLPKGAARLGVRGAVFYFRSPSLKLPGFSIRQFDPLQQMLIGTLGVKGVEMNHSDFSKKYLLRCSDEPAVKKCLNRAFLDYISSTDAFDADGYGDQIMIYRPVNENTTNPGHLRLRLNEFDQVKQKAIQAYKLLQGY